MDTAFAVAGEAQGNVEALYRADSARLWRALFAYSGDADVASDSVAEAYAQLLSRGAAVHDMGAWVWRAAFRIAAGALKARRLSGSTSSSRDEHMDRYGDPDLLRALADLPDSQRAAVVLFYYADLPIREIAARMGSNGLAVRANLSRGRRRLRQSLGDDHG